MTGRPKHYYSVYQKMIARNVGFDDIYDLVGIRVLVDSVRDCYAALGTVHARWNPVPGRFKDYIAMPKFNMYQSLHTTVIGPGGKPVELQIRTWGMHRRAEYGVAAHWKYKEEVAGSGRGGRDGAGDMAWLRQLVDWQRETADPAEFLESLRFDLGAAEVYVFTPRGEVIALPQGATPVDFAYAIHTEVGHRTIGARVNGRLVALESALDNGDTVEIFTSKAQDAGPSRDWLQFVKSARARNKIRHWFSKERREAATETGKTAIARAMRKHGLPLQRLATGDALLAIATELHYPDLSALYAAVGEGHVSAQSVASKLVQSAGGMAGAQEDLAEATLPTRPPSPGRSVIPGVVVEGASDVWARLSKCCTPVPGDEITGFITRGHGVSVHRADCLNLRHLLDSQPERLVAVRWSPDGGLAVPGGHPGGGAGPDRPALRRDPDHLRPAREHPVRLGHHDQGPGRGQPVHVRDGRPEAPRSRAPRRPRHRRRLRRLPIRVSPGGDPLDPPSPLRAEPTREHPPRRARSPTHVAAAYPARASSPEVPRGCARLLPARTGGRRWPRSASVAARVSPRCSALARRSSRLASAVRICSTVPWARASASGLERRHCVVLGLADRVLDPAQALLQAVVRLTGDRPGLLPAFLDGAQRGPGGPHVGHRDQLGRPPPAARTSPRRARAARSPWPRTRWTARRRTDPGPP